MSDDPPETPTKAARVLIGWFAGGLAFESVHAYAEQNSILAACGYGVGAIFVAIVDYKLKSILAHSPIFTKSLNNYASKAGLWIVVAILTLVIIALSPYIEQRRWPFLGRRENIPVVVHDQTTEYSNAQLSDMQNQNKILSEKVREQKDKIDNISKQTVIRDVANDSKILSLIFQLSDAARNVNDVYSDIRKEIQSHPRDATSKTYTIVPQCVVRILSSDKNQRMGQLVGFSLQKFGNCLYSQALPPAPPPIDKTDADAKPNPEPSPTSSLAYVVIRYPKGEKIKDFPDKPTMPTHLDRGEISDLVNQKVANTIDVLADKIAETLRNACHLDVRRSHNAEGFFGQPFDKWTLYIDFGNVSTPCLD